MKLVLISVLIQYIYIELDVIKIKDSFVIAHNDCEKMYDYSGNFNEIELNVYNNLKVFSKYTPMNFMKLNDILEKYKNVYFILDIKPRGDLYKETMTFIKNILHINYQQIIPQIYCINDFIAINTLGFNKCLFATYNIACPNKKLIGCKQIQDVINYIHLTSENCELAGISVHIDSYNIKEFLDFVELNNKEHIILHGQHECFEENIVYELNKNGFGLFTYKIFE